MTKSPARESPPHPSEQLHPRHRNVYDYDGEYDFHTVRHWDRTKGGPGAPRRVIEQHPNVQCELLGDAQYGGPTTIADDVTEIDT
jgi:hypothetical protein